MLSRIDRSSVGFALAAALLFGAGTPLAKYLLGSVDPWLLAGLLYLGSGIGLTAWRIVRAQPIQRLGADDARWLAGATLAGGIIAPVLLMYGLTRLPSSAAALLLNAEAVFTALLAWFAFRENFDQRIAWGMVLITVGALVLTWPGGTGAAALWPSLAIVAACLAWGIDNNLTRKISLADATVIASIKGLVAGAVNLSLAFAMGASLPMLLPAATAMATGLATYGISLVLFVLALRGLGAARTAAYFSVAPFVGAFVGLLAGEPTTLRLALAASLMALGIWLHVTESHGHEHEHEPLEHAHLHSHDAHHRHEHGHPVDSGVVHSHAHIHTRLRHSHQHYPDSHHRHQHPEQVQKNHE